MREIYKVKPNIVHAVTIAAATNIDYPELYKIFDYLRHNQYIISHSVKWEVNSAMKINSAGVNFVDTMQSFINRHEEMQLDSNIKKQSYLLNKWYIKTRWVPHILALLSFMASILAIIISLLK